MDFFQRQDDARRRTKWLVIGFTLAVCSMVVMTYGVGLIAKYYILAKTSRHSYQADFSPWDLHLFGITTFFTLLIIGGGCAWKHIELAGGGPAVAESLGGRLVDPNTSNPDERKLLNVVEEMSIASGVPMPQVYLLEDEDGLNAFAAGHTTSDAVVTVTAGSMKRLSRDELQGVIGHEFSHILNGDMRLNVRLISLLFGIFCLATIGRILLNTTSSGRRDRNQLWIVGLLLLVIGSAGYFFGRLIQAAVSRQREFLADASSVQFTRNPAGLSGALQKVGGYTSLIYSPHASDAAHLFFSDVSGSAFFGAMATHPPLDQRIRAIDPAWDGKFHHVADAERDLIHAEETAPPRKPLVADQQLARMIWAGGAMADDANFKPPVIRPHTVLPNLGTPTPLHLQYAVQLRDALPDSIKTASREPLSAAALVYALILSGDQVLFLKQIAEIEKRFSREVSQKTLALSPDVATIARHVCLPIVNLAIGGLRNLNADQFQKFSDTMQWLINSDGRVELFEFVLQKIVQRHLASKFSAVRQPVVQYYTLKPLMPDCVVVLSALADIGSDDAVEVKKAFETGAPFLRAPAEEPMDLLPREQCSVEVVSEALDRLALAAPILKKNLLEACARVVGADGVIQEGEAELLRAIADTLDCPIPPLGV
ncbi:MAG TPA: M48 family metallopeptidase [Candidatus Sulfotelmatobacter sp.]|jgi:Zn-dependent protease with chaperone function|nr:M48 family metallopeptidase [Candidatus Sulfotelmatobacter sp.]